VSTSRTGVSAVVPSVTVSGDQPCERPRARTRHPLRHAQSTTASTCSGPVGAQAHSPSAVISVERHLRRKAGEFGRGDGRVGREQHGYGGRRGGGAQRAAAAERHRTTSGGGGVVHRTIDHGFTLGIA
jgi:hypothetical protein